MKTRIFLAFIIISFSFSCTEEKNYPPSCLILSPTDNQEVIFGDTLLIRAKIFGNDGEINNVNILIDNIDYGNPDTIDNKYYSWIWPTLESDTGSHSIYIICFDENGLSWEDEVTFSLESQSMVCGFLMSDLTGEAPQDISFTDTSSNFPLEWYWDFGDGNVSTDQNPTHNYVSPGLYDIYLYVSNLSGMDSTVKQIFIPGTIEIPCLGQNFLTDIDGNIYPLKEIGNQCWMTKDLKVTRYSNGSSIPYITSPFEWVGLEDNNHDKGYCYYENNQNSDYGALYTFAAAINNNYGSRSNPSGIQGVCPAGWHIPSDNEWKELELFLGLSSTEVNVSGWRGDSHGGKLKETGLTHWEYPNIASSNSTEFTALPGGVRSGIQSGSYYSQGKKGYWWSSNEAYGWGGGRILQNNEGGINRSSSMKSTGISVRCVKD